MIIDVGHADRIIRVLLGLALLGLVFFIDGSWRWLGLIGLMPLITGLLGRCPGYRLLGLSTCALRKPD
ncbi:MAG: YgaP family membrane protein [Gallionella sp.]